MTTQEKEELAKKYQPLVYKIALQWIGKLPLTFGDILGYGNMGLAKALNEYNPDKINKDGNKGSQTFQQYAAYSILHSILNGSNQEGHIVKFSAYQQKKRREQGESTHIMKSIDINVGPDGDYRLNIPEIGEEDKYIGLKDVYSRLYDRIESKFSKRDCDIFYKVLGLKDYKIVKGTDLAKQYHIAPCTITIIKNKIVNYIKQDEELCDELYELV